MPKLHLLDSGLVCWLLGIRSPDQLRTHPLRGPIFESCVVSEVLKHRWNRGENAPLHYFRDRQGSEADLVLDLGDRVRAVEVKAGKTATGELLRAAVRARDLLAGTVEVETFLVHGGDARQRRSDLTVLPWDGIDREAWIAGRSPPS